jgi:general secretion pathway protein F
MLAAGVPILDALPKSINMMRNPLLRKQFDSVTISTQLGGSLSDALAKVPEMDEQAIQLLLVGEQSGTLAKSILQHVEIEQQNSDLKDDLLAEWIPRVFYLLVTLWVANSIIVGNSIATVVGI